MIETERFVAGAAAVAEARAFLRIDGAAEDVGIGALVESACGVCEGFVGQMLVARGVSETVEASGVLRPCSGQAWTRLRRTPVVSVTEVVELRDRVVVGPVLAGDYALDIDGNGDGWVRSGGTWFASGHHLRVAYRAGMAANWSDVPAALRQGIVRLVAHLYADRDADGAPPAAVAALWRPYRRMPLGGAHDRLFARARGALR